MIIYINSGATSATTITIPTGHNTGDILLMFAFNSASTTNPTLPAGWANIQTPAGANVCAMVLAYKIAISNADTSGTWTTATQLVCMVYRGINNLAPVGVGATGSGTGTSITYPATTLAKAAGNTWVIGFAGHVTATNVNVAPTGLTIKASAITNVGGSDTNARTLTDYAATALTVNASSGWFATTVELFPATTTMNNYQQFSGQDGISVGEKVR